MCFSVDARRVIGLVAIAITTMLLACAQALAAAGAEPPGAQGGQATAQALATKAAKPRPPRKGQKPMISGTAQDGQLLTASTGTWRGTAPFAFAYRWESCLRQRCAQIPGATESSYRAESDTIGRTLKVIVTAENSVGHASNHSKASAAVVAGPPVSIGQPTISGTPVPGETLEASAGGWAGTAPISYRYQWLDCPTLGECLPIPGAESSTYTVQALELTSSLEVTVTASNAEGEVSATSAQTPPVHAVLPRITQLPSIVGELLDGQLLKALVGSWTGTGPLSYSYQWELCDATGENCKSISEALASGLSLVSSFVGKTLRVAVTATNEAGSSTALSPATSAIGALAPIETSLPSIGGIFIDGQHLSAQVGSWEGTGPIHYSYQWELCNPLGTGCLGIGEAFASTLALVSGDVGSTLRVAVTASNQAGATTAISEPSNVVAALVPANTALPTIGGSLVDGQLLKALAGSWEGTGPLSYSYQWQLCNGQGEECKDISEALASGLSLVPSFVGKTVRVAVTASNQAGSTTAVSEATAPVAALAPADTGLPTIAGTLLDGQRLSAQVGSWEGTGPLTYSYQWQLCNGQGEECKDISEALASGLSLVSSFVGKTVRVAVTASNQAGSATAVSEASSPVQALAPANTELPSIVGNLLDGQALRALVGTWTGTGPLTYSYQWELCDLAGTNCNAISEALGPTLSLLSIFIGKTVRVAVTASNQAGSATAMSPISGRVAPAPPASTEAPRLSGTAEDGQTLTASTGSWTGTAPIGFAYQWELCNAAGEQCASISEAHERALQLESNEVGKTVRVTVTASNEGGTASASSPVSAPIAPAPPTATGIPIITGLLVVGQTLSVSSGSWAGTPPMTFAYQWEDCGTLGLTCSKIAGATEAKLKLGKEAFAQTSRAQVTATNAAGSASSRSLITVAVIL